MFYPQDQFYSVMYFKYHNVNFKHITLYCYDNWNDEQDVNTFSISNLNNLCFLTKLGQTMQGFIYKILLLWHKTLSDTTI